jgi:cytochrome c-type biogenesis protein CcmF
LWLAVWIACSTLGQLVERIRAGSSTGLVQRLRSQSGSYYGMLLAHLGVAVFVAGVTVVSSFQSESDVRMEVGDTADAGGYTVRLEGVQLIQGPNYSAARARLLVTKGDSVIGMLEPERRIYLVSRMPLTEVAIDRGIWRDVYVAMGEPVSATAWSMRIHHKPMVNWIWGGCLLMALGGLLAVLDRRYRARRAVSPASAGNPLQAATAGAAA